MGRLLKAFLFKLRKDLAFRITLFIGLGLALFSVFGYFIIERVIATETEFEGVKFLSGQSMLISSMTPAQNFGLAIPLNVIIYVCLEFSQGTIRNKIISGHSKFKIYTSLYVSGLILAFLLVGAYVLLSTLLGTLFGGFNLNDLVISTSTLAGVYYTVPYILKMIAICVVVYASLISFTVFFASLFRSIGPSIPVVIVVILGCSFLATFGTLFEAFENEVGLIIVKIIDPLYCFSAAGVDSNNNLVLDNATFFMSLGGNLVYTALWFLAGSAIFRKRDIK